MPGQPNCWQCGASLPPPEIVGAAQAPQAPAFAQHAQPWQQTPAPSLPAQPAVAASGRKSRAWMVAVPVILAVVALFVFAFAKLQAARSRGPADDLKAQIEALKKQMGQTPSVAGNATEDDPQVAAAKEQIERLRRENGIEAPADSSGNVHLQTGGTVTREQYQKALDSLSRSNLGK